MGIFTKSYKINLTIPPSCLRQPTVSPAGSVGASALNAEVSTGDPHPLQERLGKLLIFAEFSGDRRSPPTGCAMLYRVGRGLAPAVKISVFIITFGLLGQCVYYVLTHLFRIVTQYNKN